MSNVNIASAIEAYGPGLLQLKNVVGVGESHCNGEPCIRVYLAQADHATLSEIPAQLDGITVIKEISGPITAGQRKAS